MGFAGSGIKPLITTVLIGGVSLTGCTEFSMESLRDSLDPVPRAEDGTRLAPRPKPDSRGIITYPNYQVIVAKRGDEMGDVAARVGMDPAALARYNGLDVGYVPRPGEVLALPKGVVIPLSSGDDPNDLERIASSAIDRSEQITGVTQEGPEPIRHVVETGETAYTIARLYDVSVTSLASWNGLDGDLSVRVGQRLLIPVAADGAIRRSSLDPVATEDTTPRPGEGSVTPEPPSAEKPLPDTVEVATVPESPDLGVTRTEASGVRKLLKPVNGTVVRGYSNAPGGNEGLDIAARPGTSVKAADDGEVALISRATGGGSILLIRHKDNLYTVYSNVSDVSVIKGQTVRRGQSVAKIASDADYLHFEIRRGTESVDPTPFL